MIKIGDFAKICNVSPQTLRYYDAEGILKADHTDEVTGYRFYAPQAVEKYKQILLYKRLGFSLEEIRELQNASEGQAQRLFLDRRRSLLAELQEIQERIADIDGITKGGGLKYLTSKEWLNLPFADQPEMVGKWRLCGTLTDENDMDSVMEDCPCEAKKEIILMPGGAPVWNYFWTKGIFYVVSSRYNFAIPNCYRTAEKDGTLYMIMQFMTNDCIEKGADAVTLLYKQINKEAYTEHSVRAKTDETDLPFVEDLDILGEWETCDYVHKISDFVPDTQRYPGPLSYITGICFYPRGVCIRMIRKGTKVPLRYTKGTLLNDRERTAEAYTLKEIDGKKYLFIQHKSGDYFYGGHVPSYYVFERREDGQ